MNRLKFFQDTSDVEGRLLRLKKSLQSIDIIGFIDAIAAEDGFIVGRQHFPAQRAGRKGLGDGVGAELNAEQTASSARDQSCDHNRPEDGGIGKALGKEDH